MRELQFEEGWLLVSLRMLSAPAGAGVTVGFSDDFTTNKVAQYTFDAGQADFAIAGGALAPGLNKTIRAYVTGYTPADFEMLIRLTTGASVTGVVLDMLGVDQDMDSSDALVVELAAADKSIYNAQNGVFTRSAGAAAAGVFVSTSKWYRFVKAGDRVTAERWPGTGVTYKADAEDRMTVDFSGGVGSSRFGAGVKGPIGFRLSTGSVNAATLDELIIRGLDL